MLDKLLKKPYFFNIFLALLFILSLVFVITEQQVTGAVIFGCIAAISLVLFSDVTVFLTPTLLLSVFVTVCYDSFDTFIKFLPLAVPLAFCVVFNLVKYKVKPRTGTSFKGVAAVAIAVTLGGVGTIPIADYFSPTALFYVFALGGGMVLLYLLFSSRITSESGLMLAKTMYASGLLATVIIVHFYYVNWEEFVNSYRFLTFQPANNLSTFLMLALPFPFYFARTRHFDFIFAVIMYLGIVFSSSRAGLLMGTAEFGILLIVYSFAFEKKWLKRLLYLSVAAGGVLLFLKFLPNLVLRISYKSLIYEDASKMTFSDCVEILKVYFIKPDEHRWLALKRCVGDFLSNPLFGTGFGYKGNTDIYMPKTGAMNWYHLWTAQIFGGLGGVGVLAYGYQLFIRAKTYFKNASPLNLTMFMSYIGLWLMSQLNPGEFCPIPYALIATVYFINVERKKNEDTKTDSGI